MTTAATGINQNLHPNITNTTAIAAASSSQKK